MAQSSTETASDSDMALFKPPTIPWTGGALNRALFSKTYNLSAARVHDARNIAKWRKTLSQSKDLLTVERLPAIFNDPDASLAAQGRKCLLLRPGIVHDAPDTWSETLSGGVKQEELGVIPYVLTLNYDFWSARDMLCALLPEQFHDDMQTGFNTAGHVAHFNLRENFVPYKYLIAEILLDKSPGLRTVINKVDSVGTHSEFRTFAYEVLAGPDDMNIEVRENECTFKFNYAEVYWNSKLEKEHTRLVKEFQPGQVVCDVMAGIGPFAVPAGKKGVFVWANDMNPRSFHYLQDSVERNKVTQYVRPFNEDGRTFIKTAAKSVFAASNNGEAAVIMPKSFRHAPDKPKPEPRRIPIPPTISHFVMNLPASAIEFLPCYRGVYAGHEDLFGDSGAKLPMVHVHCFAVKSDDDVPKLDICERISEQLGMKMTLGDPEKQNEVAVNYVRAVAPAKSMYCASFRLPVEIAFAQPDVQGGA